MSHIPSREEALELLKKYNKSESLLNHAFAVEGVMRHFAQLYNEDPEKWGIIGLIHDLDYEQYPDQHCKMTEKILQENNWPQEYVRAVLSHGWGICTDVKPEHIMEKTLYTIDELTGLITATALVRPSKSVMDMKVKSVKKKWKQKSFAAGADRELIEKGAEMMDMEVSEVISHTIEGMKQVADQIGLSQKE
ncbi:MAG: HD domain-containing protein [Spirochaetia bacterium]